MALTTAISLGTPNGYFSLISIGSNHFAAIKSDGTLWTWGDNQYGQLGQGDTTARDEPTQVGVLTTWSSVVCGADHTLAIKTDGTLWAWGRNDYCQLGNGADTTNDIIPTQVGAATTWSTLSAGLRHSVARRTDNTLWSWGSNTRGQCGQGVTDPVSSPTQVGVGTQWTSVVCGQYHTMALLTDGVGVIKLYTTGENEYGQLGQGNTTDKTTFTQVGVSTAWSDIASGPVAEHSFAKLSGIWLACGRNLEGQLGMNNITSPVTSFTSINGTTSWSSFACGNNFSIGIDTSGIVYSTGYNPEGQLGQGNTDNLIVFTQVGTSVWSSVYAGTSWSVVLSPYSVYWVTGMNTYGQHGFNDTSVRYSLSQNMYTFNDNTDVEAWSETSNTNIQMTYNTDRDGVLISTPKPALDCKKISISGKLIGTSIDDVWEKYRELVYWLNRRPTNAEVPGREGRQQLRLFSDWDLWI